MSKTNRILIIVTNVGGYEKVGYRTGKWIGEPTQFSYGQPAPCLRRGRPGAPPRARPLT